MRTNDTPAAVRAMLARLPAAVTPVAAASPPPAVPPPAVPAPAAAAPGPVPANPTPTATTTATSTDTSAGTSAGTSTDNLLRLTPVEALICIGALAIAVLGFISSFDAVSRMAARTGGFSPRLAYTVPLAFDLGILVFSALRVLLTRRSTEIRMAPRWLRFVVYGLTAATVYANVVAGHTLTGQILHAVMVSLWVAFVEVATFVARRLMNLDDDQRIESIPRSRWMLSPFRTLRLWRRMVLWHITSYEEALKIEDKIQEMKIRLRHKHGRRWRRKAKEDILAYRRLTRLSPRRSQTGDPTNAAPLPGTPVTTTPVTTASVTPTQVTGQGGKRQRTGQADRAAQSAGQASPGQVTGQVTGQADRAATGELTGDDLLVSYLVGPIREAARRGEQFGRPRALRVLRDALPDGQTVPGSDRMRRVLAMAQKAADSTGDGQVLPLTGHRSG